MPSYIVRYGTMRALGVHTTRGSEQFQRGQRVVARTNRGLEVGEVLSEATEDAVKSLKDPPSGQILRAMTLDDENESAHIDSKLSQEFDKCREYVQQLKLQMDLVDIEHLFGGERIVVYYLAEQRVDFRELVKQLASEFQTRIEMRQIGVRDEAKLLADYGDCGKPVCCNTHLHAMPPVSMKMAKLQKATLDPTKISGRCGRLKCCLRYEYDTYEQLYKELPPVGSEIVTDKGRARVLGQEILAEQLLIVGEDNNRMVIHANEVLTVLKRGSGRRSKSKPPQEAPTQDPPEVESAPTADKIKGPDTTSVESHDTGTATTEAPKRPSRGKSRRSRGGRSNRGKSRKTDAQSAPQQTGEQAEAPPAEDKNNQNSDADATQEDNRPPGKSRRSSRKPKRRDP